MESDGPLEDKEDDSREDEPVTVPPKKAGRSRKAAAAPPPPPPPKSKPKAKAETPTNPTGTKGSTNSTTTSTTTTTAAATDGASPAKKKRGPKRKSHGSDDADVKKKKYVMTHPRTLDMVTEALDELQDPQGSSVQAIRSWIIANYKTVRPDMVKMMLKRALKQGLTSGAVCRPKGQAEATPLVGRYKVGKPGSDSDPSHPAPPRTNPRPARNQALVKGLGSITLKKKGKKKKGSFGKKAKRPGMKSKKK